MSANPRTQPLTEAEFRAVAMLLRQSGTPFESRVAGTSMEPTVPDGSRICIAPPPTGAFEEGQIVACVIGDALFAHRIIHCGGAGRAGEFVLTQGDGWILCDPPTRRSDILGAVTAYWRDGHWRAPEPCAPRASWQRAVSAASIAIVRAALRVHHQLARRVAGTCLVLGALCKRLLAR